MKKGRGLRGLGCGWLAGSGGEKRNGLRKKNATRTERWDGG